MSFVANYRRRKMLLLIWYISPKGSPGRILALEEEAEALDDEFIKKGLQLVVDGSDPQLVLQYLRDRTGFCGRAP